MQQTWDALYVNFLLAALITYLLMAALFESWLYPLVIILSVPMGAIGGIAGLAVLNLFVFQPLDVLTMLGFVILIGTVVNNPILIVHQALLHIREEGMTVRAAVLAAVGDRIRPIFMTTVTTVLGLLPLVPVSRRRQRAVSRTGHGVSRRTDCLHCDDAVARADSVQPDDGAEDRHLGPAIWSAGDVRASGRCANRHGLAHRRRGDRRRLNRERPCAEPSRGWILERSQSAEPAAL